MYTYNNLKLFGGAGVSVEYMRGFSKKTKKRKPLSG